jgi:hypothetical protein|eukprot:COSAG06_NODE_2611_length_6581_cov_21.257443_4_plen_146_part_00
MDSKSHIVLLFAGRDGPETAGGGSHVARKRERLDEFVRSGMAGRYSFDRTTVFEDYPALKEDFELPPLFAPTASSETAGETAGGGGEAWKHLTFSVGPSGEGLGFHYHDAAINAVVWGKKRWFTCPNYEDMNETQFDALKVRRSS